MTELNVEDLAMERVASPENAMVESEEATRVRKERQLAINRQAQQRHREKRKAREVDLVQKIEVLERTVQDTNAIKDENQRLRTYLELIVRHSDLLKQELEFKNLQLNTLKPGSVPETRPRELPIPPSGLKEVLTLTQGGTDLGLQPAVDPAALHNRSLVVPAQTALATASPSEPLEEQKQLQQVPNLNVVKTQNLSEFVDTLHAYGNQWSLRSTPDDESSPPSTKDGEDLLESYIALCHQLRVELNQHLISGAGLTVTPGNDIPRLLGECKLIFAKMAVLKNHTALRDQMLKAKPGGLALTDGSVADAGNQLFSSTDNTEDTSVWLKSFEAMKLTPEQVAALLQIRHSHLEDLTAIYDHRQVITRHAMQLAESLSMFVRGITPTGITREVWDSHAVMKSTLEDITHSLTDEQALFKRFHVATWGLLNPIQAALFITNAGPLYPDMLALVNSISYIQQQQHNMHR